MFRNLIDHMKVSSLFILGESFANSSPTFFGFPQLQGLFLAATLGIFVYYVFVWGLVGQDKVVIPRTPQADPKDNISPTLMSYILNKGLTTNLTAAFTATLVSIAQKGSLSIERVDRGKTLKISKQQPSSEPHLTPSENFIHSQLWPKGSTSIVLDGEYNSHLSQLVMNFSFTFYKEYKNVYFVSNFYYLLLGLLASIGLLFVFGMFHSGEDASFILVMTCFGAFFFSIGVFSLLLKIVHWDYPKSINQVIGLIVMIAFVAAGSIALSQVGTKVFSRIELGCVTALFFMNLMFGYLLPSYTEKGRQVLGGINSYLLFLKSGYSSFYHDFSPPVMTRELFEKHLPYALALEVEEEWGSAFEDNQKRSVDGEYKPAWFKGELNNSGYWQGGPIIRTINSLGELIDSTITPPTRNNS